MKSQGEKAVGRSKTIPGQSLYPSDLMKRHLAGTLPDIDLSSKYEYHYDEEGNKISDRLPIEMHELHALAVALRKKQFEAATEHRKQLALKEREQIIEEWKKQNPGTPPENLSPKPPTEGTPSATGPVSGSGRGKRGGDRK